MDDDDSRPGRVELLRFRVGDERHALEVGRVDAIEKVPTVTPVPRTPATVAGVARPRGETVVVVDAHALLGTGTRPSSGDDPRHRFLALDRDPDDGGAGPDRRTGAGFVVDEVERTVVVDATRLAAPDAPEVDPGVADPDVHLVVATTEEGPLPVIDAEAVVAVATRLEGVDGESAPDHAT
jgi:purine-binding chemotaxis protein CheW